MPSVKRYRVYAGPPGDISLLGAFLTRDGAIAEARRHEAIGARVVIWDVKAGAWIWIYGRAVTSTAAHEPPNDLKP